ncbi:MAG: hypothetical protein M3069_08095, partial [Chloroflexota bacterium]|nr:hypothetical protein [Chloroflexota bacterium]
MLTKEGLPAEPLTESAARPIARIVAVAATKGWGWLPGLSLVGALALFVVALAINGARSGAMWAEPLFWLGLLGLFGPIAVRVAGVATMPGERLGLVVMLGLGLYLVRVLGGAPSTPDYDELLHWRTTNDILATHRLFTENPLLPVGPYFPGLELTTSALVSLSGLPIFAAGALVVGAARLVLLLALYLLYLDASGSARLAGIGVLLYMGNPAFVFFDASFAYESLALPLCLLAVYAAARRAQRLERSQLGLTLTLLLALGAVITTHHVSSYALVTFLLIWTVSTRAVRSDGGDGRRSIGATALVTLVLALAWLVYVASLVVGYLAPNLWSGVDELLRLMDGRGTSRHLFANSAGQLAPVWDRVLGYASVGLILLGLPVGLLQVWRRYRRDALTITLALAALAYPLSLALRLTASGAELSSRTSEFLFVGIAFVLALAAVERWPVRNSGWRSRTFVSGVAVVIFAGGVVVGVPAWARLPGPYLVAADARSIEPQGVNVALWARSFLGPGNRVAADRVNRLLMGSYGEQRVVTAYGDRVDVAGLFFAPQLGASERDVLHAGSIRYVLVDRRLSTGLPLSGAYFDLGECPQDCARPLPSASLEKFDRLDQVARVFDSGDIVIYDVSELASISPAPAGPAVAGPAAWSRTLAADPSRVGWQAWPDDAQTGAWPSAEGYRL